MNEWEILLQAIYDEVEAFGKEYRRVDDWRKKLEILAKLAIRCGKLLYFYWRKKTRPKI